MTSTATWFDSVVAWLDERGKAAWITAMVLGFIFLWPVGLAILFYMIWSKRMTGNFFACKRNKRAPRATGNSAFDAYKADTLSRLEEEQHAFQSFLKRLRDAKDKTEFDEFMDDRSKELKAAG